MELRPKINDVMKLDAAKIVAAKMAVTDIEGTAESIAEEYSYPMDGFELAKKLDKWQSWDTTRDKMEALDEIDSLVSTALRRAEKEWFERNNIKPTLAIGARIQWRDVIGEITGVSDYGHGKYLVKPDKSTIGDGRYIVNFEDAQLVTGDQHDR